jgi:hypothetical protein
VARSGPSQTIGVGLPEWTTLRATTRSGPHPYRRRPRRGLPLSPHDGIMVPAGGGICPWRDGAEALGLAPCPMEVARERDKLSSNPATLDWRKTGGRAELLALLTEKIPK